MPLAVGGNRCRQGDRMQVKGLKNVITAHVEEYGHSRITALLGAVEAVAKDADKSPRALRFALDSVIIIAEDWQKEIDNERNEAQH